MGYLITHLLVEREVISPKFCVLPLPSSQIKNYNLIKKKRIQGLYDHQIGNIMNESNFKPQQTDKFTLNKSEDWNLRWKND